MSIKLSDSIRVGQQKPLEDKYFNELVPYTSTAQVNTLLPKAVRHIGLTVNINGEEYWYKDGIENEDLVLKINNIDTSNLVPYTGANKDVNIASNYFKTSKGFELTKDADNYFRVQDIGNYNTLDFSSLDTGDDNFGRVIFLVNPDDNLYFYKENNSGFNHFSVNEINTYSKKKFSTNEGYQIIGGTPNQVLTADGGVFDLDTKADLENGKIPASQLPAYVDDVLEFANLASFPATGESGKIYIALDTNLTYRWGGSSYVVMSSSLALGETSSTAYRGDRGKIAYNHSQATGNAHNTKVEELTDVGSETPSIEDTDIILKKEVGGLWKKITFANFKSWFTTELAKKINIGLDTVFNFKNISAMALSDFRNITPNIETIYFTEEQNSTGWQQVRYNSNFFQGCTELVEKAITINAEKVLELNSDSSFNLIDIENTKIKGIFENEFVIITFSGQVWTQNTATANQWVKLILKINDVQAAVAPVFYLTEPAGTPERISYSFALNVTAEMVTHGATLHLKPSAYVTLYRPSITVARVHKSTNANF